MYCVAMYIHNSYQVCDHNPRIERVFLMSTILNWVTDFIENYNKQVGWQHNKYEYKPDFFQSTSRLVEFIEKHELWAANNRCKWSLAIHILITYIEHMKENLIYSPLLSLYHLHILLSIQII